MESAQDTAESTGDEAYAAIGIARLNTITITNIALIFSFKLSPFN